jgi:ABC-type phosphate transport system ATPase subunit
MTTIFFYNNLHVYYIMTQSHMSTTRIITQSFFRMTTYMCIIIVAQSHTSTTRISSQCFFLNNGTNFVEQ